ncbi:MAG: MFS transporter [Proteobacteria bacterium]|nr:MFS transporter [Pseudomonadota bacterium]
MAADTPPDSPPGTWTALEHKVFRRFWIFSFFAFIGASLQNVGAAWLMVDLGGTPLQVSLVQGIMSLSVVLVALPSGAVADLFDRRYIMLGSLSGLMLATAGTGALALTGHLSPQLLLALTFVFGASSSLMTPAMQSTIPDLVSRATLPSAVTLNGMTSSASRSVGPAFAGILISLLGAGITLITNVLAFVGLWLVVATLGQSLAVNAPAQQRPSIASAIRVGLRFAVTDSHFRRLLIRTLACFVGVSALLGLLPSLVAQRFDDVGAAGARHLGWFLSCYGVGSVLGSLSIARVSRRFSRDKLILMGTLVSGIAMLAIVYGESSSAMSVAMFAAGMSWAVALTSINIEAQLILPKPLLARGLSISLMALMIALTTGSVIWGAIATRWSIPVALTGAATVTIIAAMAQWFSRSATSR